jgi:hypothetical protein
MRKHAVIAVSLVTLALAADLAGQQSPQQAAPRVGYVFPAGGQQGSRFRIDVAGQFLEGVDAVLISGRGVHAAVAGYDRPLAPRQINELRDKVQELQKRVNEPGVRQEIATIRGQIADSLTRNTNPAIAEVATLEITIQPDADPGVRSLRLTTPRGLSNPLVFAVGRLPEFREAPAAAAGGAEPIPEITLPIVVNGRIVPGEAERAVANPRQAGQYLPGDSDRYRFHARKDQDLVVAVSARDLMPYLADAVPGWFQATIALFDSTGRELAYMDDYRYHPDPVLRYRIPADGEYSVEIKDALFRGREDFVYRLAIGELPFVTSVFPLGGPAGKVTDVELTGWNLTSTKLTIDGRDRQPGILSIDAPCGDLRTNAVPFSMDALPEVFEREPNNSPKAAQRVTLPAIVNGRIDDPADGDAFSFNGRAGDQIVAEVVARRLGSPLDSSLELVDEAGRRVAFNDDVEDRRFGLITHHADSFVAATIATSGVYTVRVGNVQRQGGPEYAYRLRIAPPSPDFDLTIAPSAINARGGATIVVTAWVTRRDGFAGDVALALKDAPGGYIVSGGVVPAAEDHVRFTVTVPPTPAVKPFSVRVEGRAVIRGQTVVRQAVPADEMMQAFAYRHLVPADDLRVFVAGRGGTRAAARVLSAQPVRIPAGGAARVQVAVPPMYRTLDNVEFELSDPPAGVTLGKSSMTLAGAELVLQVDAATVKPGLRGNLIVLASGERTPAGAAPTAPGRQRVVLGPLPAIRFEVVASVR